MTTSFTSEQILEVANSSPAAVARHDRRAWVDLFSRNCTVEDPVGSRPHQGEEPDEGAGRSGREPLERFYDTYIAPNEITFHVEHDIVTGNLVVRDVSIEVRMSTGVAPLVPMHLLYEVTSEDGILKIRRLRAHWELLPMIGQMFTKGASGLSALFKLSSRTMRFQGVTGALGFARGFLGIHGRGKQRVRQFVEAVNRRDREGIGSVLDESFQEIGFPAGQQSVGLESFLDEVGSGLTMTKLISSGYFTSFTFHEDPRGRNRRGVGIFEFNPSTQKILSAQFYLI
jgi:hypothetical protein